MLRGFFYNRSSVLVVGGVLAILSAGLGATAPAHAAERLVRSERAGHADHVVRTERVSYADLNLNASAGRAALQGRIKRAVRRVCRNDGAAMIALRVQRKCEVATMQDALAQMRSAVQYAELADRS